MENILKFGIVGVGGSVAIADKHADAIAQLADAEISALFSPRAEKCVEFAARHKISPAICASFDELLERCDCLILCTPNNTHANYVARALERGRAVLCEKPFGGSEEEIARALAVARRGGVATVAYNMRYRPEFYALRELVGSGALGRIFSVRMELGGTRTANPAVPFEWRMDKERSGAGALSDFGSHMLDGTIFLLGGAEGDVADISARSAIMIKERPFEGGTHPVTSCDMATISGQFEGGALFTFECSRVGMPGFRILLTGSGGMARYDEGEKDELWLYLKKTDGAYIGEPETVPLPAKEDCYLLQLEAFCAGVRAGTSAHPTLFEAANVAELLRL